MTLDPKNIKMKDYKKFIDNVCDSWTIIDKPKSKQKRPRQRQLSTKTVKQMIVNKRVRSHES